MSRPYLEVTYRLGKPLAAYLYLERRPGDKAANTQRRGELLVDLAADGRPIGIEFTSIVGVDLAAVNRILLEARHAAVSAGDLAPLTAA
jgi:uncharacterized protein YuzE